MKMTRELLRVAGWVFVGLCAGAVVVILVTVLVNTSKTTTAIRATQKTNTAVNATNTQLLKIINSCLTPGESCYRLGQQQRADSARGNQQSSAAAAACAASLPRPTYGAVLHCVRRSLRTETPHSP